MTMAPSPTAMTRMAAGPDLFSLELFLTVARTGSISSAAVLHALSQPAASQRLTRLERSLGVKLLQRGPAGASLTTSGTALLGQIEVLVEGAAGLVDLARSLRDGAASSLRIAASLTIADFVLPAWLAVLRASANSPDVAVSVGNSGHVAECVRSSGADIGFVEGPVVPDGCSSQVVGADRLSLVVSPRHPWAQANLQVTVEMLSAAPLVLRERGSGTRDSLDVAVARAGGRPVRPVLELGSTAAIRQAASDLVGIAVLSRLAVSAQLERGELQELSAPEVDLTRVLRAVWRNDRHLSSLAGSLLNIARTQPALDIADRSGHCAE